MSSLVAISSERALRPGLHGVHWIRARRRQLMQRSRIADQQSVNFPNGPSLLLLAPQLNNLPWRDPGRLNRMDLGFAYSTDALGASNAAVYLA